MPKHEFKGPNFQLFPYYEKTFFFSDACFLVLSMTLQLCLLSGSKSLYPTSMIKRMINYIRQSRAIKKLNFPSYAITKSR